MENQLYIRFRGRVLGPYDKPKLQSLVRRGQLSQMHELSTDSIHWVPAAKYPELFAGEEMSQTVASPQSAKVANQTVDGDQKYRLPTEKRWWYRKNESQVGPVEENALRQSLASGTLSLDDFVWTEGLPQWLPARQVPELAAVNSSMTLEHNQSFAHEADKEKQNVPVSICRAAASSAPWVLFLSIIAFVSAALGLIGGAIQVVIGTKIATAPVVAYGLCTIIGGIICGIGGYLLMDYARHLGKVRIHSMVIDLEKALDRIRKFWIFVTINVIVWLAFVIIAIIVICSVGITLPIQ